MRDCRFSGRMFGKEIADLAGWSEGREIADFDLVGGDVGERLQI